MIKQQLVIMFSLLIFMISPHTAQSTEKLSFEKKGERSPKHHIFAASSSLVANYLSYMWRLLQFQHYISCTIITGRML